VSPPQIEKGSTHLRWFARLIGTLGAGMWMFIIIGSIVKGLGPLDPESLFLSILILLSTFSVVVAWRREGLGGAMVLASGIAYAIFSWIAAGRNKLFAAAISGGPFILSGILFLLSWRSQKE
jgi:hypothetical protein